VSQDPSFASGSSVQWQERWTSPQESLGGLFGRAEAPPRQRAEAREILQHEEEGSSSMPMPQARALCRRAVGISSIDEIDKIAGRAAARVPTSAGGGAARPSAAVEGSASRTSTAGATDHVCHRLGRVPRQQPSDLIPELQGRFPIRVELQSLGAAEFVRI